MYKKQGHEAFDGLLERLRHDIVHTIFHVAPAGQAAPRSAGSNGRAAAVDTTRTETVMAKAIGRRTTAAPAAPVNVPPNAPRWMRRQAERAAGGGKKARKRKQGG